MAENERDVTTWRREAACRDLDTGVFFPLSEADAGPAKEVCAVCPVREECLEFALVTHQGDGVLGGLTETERRRLGRGRREAARRAA